MRIIPNTNVEVFEFMLSENGVGVPTSTLGSGNFKIYIRRQNGDFWNGSAWSTITALEMTEASGTVGLFQYSGLPIVNMSIGDRYNVRYYQNTNTDYLVDESETVGVELAQANIISSNNIDFGALQKSSLNTAISTAQVVSNGTTVIPEGESSVRYSGRHFDVSMLTFTGTSNQSLVLSNCGGALTINCLKTAGWLDISLYGFTGRVYFYGSKISQLHLHGCFGDIEIDASTSLVLEVFGGLVNIKDTGVTYVSKNIKGVVGTNVLNAGIIAGLISYEQIQAIKAKSDQLAFSVAGQVDANSKTTAAPANMALDSTVAKDASVSKPGTAQTISSNSDITAIKAKTDILSFTGTDVKATLDGEGVTVSDKTGFSLSAAGILAIWSQAASALASVTGSLGKKLNDWILGTDNKALISTDAQDLSATLSVKTKRITDEAINDMIKIWGFKKETSANGLQVKIYNLSNTLVVTLDRTGTGPYVWTPTLA